MSDPRYFKTAMVSSAAAIKMLAHATSGVDKGLKQGSRPVEVMGLLLGRPSTGADKHVLIVTDAYVRLAACFLRACVRACVRAWRN